MGYIGRNWAYLEESREFVARQRAVAQNGNTALHYPGEQLEIPFPSEEGPYTTEGVLAPLGMKLEFDPETFMLGKMDTYVFNRKKLLTIEDIRDVFSGLNIQISDFGSGLSPEVQKLVDKGLFKPKED